MPAARIFFQLIADFVVYLGLLIRPRKAIAAENLFLRRQLALYQERKVDPRRNDPATRITLALLSSSGHGTGKRIFLGRWLPSQPNV